MLGQLLSKEDCAACRGCCIFDCYSVWESPVFDSETSEKIKALRPGTHFAAKDGGFIYIPECSGDHYECAALGKNGCVLGDEKPFDCRFFPFMLMEKDGCTVITLSPICPAMSSKPAEEMIAALRSGLADTAFSYGEREPGIVRPYREGYPVLMTRDAAKNE